MAQCRRDRTGWEETASILQKKKYELLSAVVNLAVIQVFGAIYGALQFIGHTALSVRKPRNAPERCGVDLLQSLFWRSS